MRCQLAAWDATKHRPDELMSIIQGWHLVTEQQAWHWAALGWHLVTEKQACQLGAGGRRRRGMVCTYRFTHEIIARPTDGCMDGRIHAWISI